MVQPMAQEQMPQQAAPQEQSAPGGGIDKLVANIQSGMAMLTDAVSEARPELAEQAMGIMQAFEGLIDAISGSSEQASQPAAIEQGAAQAQPASPATL